MVIVTPQGEAHPPLAALTMFPGSSPCSQTARTSSPPIQLALRPRPSSERPPVPPFYLRRLLGLPVRFPLSLAIIWHHLI
jgi:hypothetical protein